ncbi:rhomboid family intramembrane serine protease [Desulfobacter latus]|uniref:Rhomboid family intramembrane serine protease n=1 Tax=Desulfobacter latus TaxID=2292 RepID=A0A850TBY3_9BACT|nr:rhomboid family intramembrane serine protease [Desulfobacter latus]NWH04886.1 rhomboid family intramembrane serine protease [Desulfobacter latus]
MESIFTGSIQNNNSRKQADLILIILASQSVRAVIDTSPDGSYNILVPDDDVFKAREQLKKYARENKADPRPPPHVPTKFFFSPAALALAFCLAAIHYIITTRGLHQQAILDFGSSSYYLSQGQSFRAVTALFLHSDTKHLLGNMAGLLVLAGPLLRVTGYGQGLLLLLAAGTAGNLISESFGRDLRLSIGASTAVMAAAGLLGARRMTIDADSGHSVFPKLKGLAPFAAAATLTAMFSHGDNTDVSAHLFGFLAGTGIGLCYYPLSAPLSGPVIGRISFGIVLGILCTAVIQGVLTLLPG